MVKVLGNYHVVVDGVDQLLTGIHNLPGAIEKELIEKGFAEEIEEKKLTGEEKETVKTFFLANGKLTEKAEPVVVTSLPVDDSKITLEALLAMTEEEIDALAVEKNITLTCKKQDTKANELFKALGV